MTNADLVRLNEQQARTRRGRLRQHAQRRGRQPSGCSTRGSAPSGGCGCSATASGYCEGLEAADAHASFWTSCASYGLPPTPHVECFRQLRRGGRRIARS